MGCSIVASVDEGSSKYLKTAGIKKERLWTLLFLFSVIPFLIFASPKTPNKVTSIPNTDAREKELWELINKERKLHNLPLLELLSVLSDMARLHSLDMANQGKSELSNLSSSGKYLTDRLKDAGFFYVDAGENVAFSETFMAESIYKNLFESSELKENILNPDFSQIGIGIVYRENKGYYITQNFLRPILIKADKQVSQIVLDRINTERHLNALPSIDFWQEAEQFAKKLAESKANGQDLLEIPQTFGETFIVFLSTPSLTQEDLNFPEAVNTRYNSGALGIWFGKKGDYPGGVYVFALMLFVENRSQPLNIEEQKKHVLELVNKIRIQYGLKMVTLDERLSKNAEKMALNALKGQKSEMPKSRGYIKSETLSFETENISLFPPSLIKIVRKTELRKIGIGLIHKKNSGSQKGSFFVSFIFE